MKLKRKVYETRREKRNDFVIGFFGCYAVNAAIIYIIASVSSGLDDPYFTSEAAGNILTILLALPLVINAIAIALLALSRTWIALGILAAIGAVFLVVLVGGLLLMAMCYASF